MAKAALILARSQADLIRLAGEVGRHPIRSLVVEKKLEVSEATFFGIPVVYTDMLGPNDLRWIEEAEEQSSDRIHVRLGVITPVF